MHSETELSPKAKFYGYYYIIQLIYYSKLVELDLVNDLYMLLKDFQTVSSTIASLMMQQLWTFGSLKTFRYLGLGL